MPKYLFSYHGGSVPETEEEQAQVMSAWGAWIGGNADAFVDGGNPTGEIMTVSADGPSEGGGANPVSGYGIVEAADMAAACALAAGCPIIEAGGHVEIGEIHDVEI